MGSVNCATDPLKVVQDALSEGVTMLQFREKGSGCLQGAHAEKLARDLQSVCAEYNVPFIINDDIELALKIDADGVHIGQEDGEPAMVRKRIGNKILGVSAHSVSEAAAAIDAGADYLGVGPMFPTSTKSDTRPVSGPALIQKMRQLGIDHPLVGIGGITPDNAIEVLRAGADGVAVISCISSSPDPGAAAERMKNVLLEARC
ncbi:thiamine phosphate synthase [Bacillus salacetis]|uniref:thiamine phosphate synthase n=1 Tax=Bacillus salacetis TaxID=2315464 RepID=UPI003BA22470